ncbi:hypothetical protein [Legionella waltersii]|uniref:Uncharacterized protein n=1 Tax=Legionella waltersii TaxID=66969 RepID=A0A0W1ALF8_9GAMM|nr:hypothetical protein [Legionella waltersii]KTD82153.1 hypothetical protein Lwal_0980 [Legionella waltersii]SNV10858.1 Uncharacterised protein [Legionella waltersii]
MDSLKKIVWNDIKHKILCVNKRFYDLIENTNSNLIMPLYLAEYSYGELLGSKKEVYLPNNSSEYIVLGSNKTPNEIMRDLAYGMNSFPLGMILNNFCEWYSIDDTEGEVYPFAIQGPGTIFNQQIIFNEDMSVENNTISVSSGAKSAFMLPYVGSKKHHERIRNHYSLSSSPPKNRYEHSNLFKELINSRQIKQSWYSQILFFSEEWINEIRHNEKWLPVKFFFSENLRKRFSTDLYRSLYSYSFLTTGKVNKYRPTPYLIDSAKYIISIAMGQGIGFAPAIDNRHLPLEFIQEAYTQHYQLDYTPTVMIPSMLDSSNDSVYYSLQIPSTKISSFKIQMNNSTYVELIALKDIIFAYQKEFQSNTYRYEGSDVFNACNTVDIEFYHNKPTDNSQGIKHSLDIYNSDKRFSIAYIKELGFSADAKFFRGCIKISKRS